MSQVFHRVVTLRIQKKQPVGQTTGQAPTWSPRVAVQLVNEWTKNLGTEPDINVLAMTEGEFEKLGGWFGGEAEVEMWFVVPPKLGEGEPTVAADVRIRKLRTVEIKRRFAGGTSGATEYLVALADLRWNWQPPLGGMLRGGLINPSAGGWVECPRDERKSIRQLLTLCLDSLGHSSAPLPDADDVLPPVNLRWERAFAVTELKRLLTRANWNVAVSDAGTVSVVRLGDGEEPQLLSSFVLPELRTEGLSRRGEAVVVVSDPTAERLSINIPSNDIAASYQFVMPAGDLSDTTGNGQATPSVPSTPRGEFKGMPSDYSLPDQIRAISPTNANNSQRDFIKHAFRFVQLNFSETGENVVEGLEVLVRGTQVQRYRFDAFEDFLPIDAQTGEDGKRFKISTPSARGNIAKLVNGRLKAVGNSDGDVAYVRNIWNAADGPVLEFDRPLIKVRAEVDLNSWTSVYEPAEDLIFRVTLEPHYAVDGNVERRCFAAGFVFDPEHEEAIPGQGTVRDGVRALSEEQTRELLEAGGNRVIISRPELQVLDYSYSTNETGFRIWGSTRDRVKLYAREFAKRFLPRPDGDEPREIVAAGFHPVETSGRVMRVAYDQEQVTTSVSVDNYHVGRAFLANERAAYEDSGRVATSQGLRDGTGGATQPVVPVLSGLHGGGGGGGVLVPVYLTLAGGSNGTVDAGSSFTYNAYNDAAKTQRVGTEPLLVKMQRAAGPVTAAKIGLLTYEADVPVLWWCDEVLESDICQVTAP